MEQLKTSAASTIQKDMDIRRLIEEKREARKQKLLARLGRNLANPVSVASLEALTGTLRSKNQPIIPSVINPSNTTTKALSTKPKELSSSVKKPSVIKSATSFGHTATSLKRAALANSGLHLNQTDTKTVPNSEKKPASAPVTHATKLQKQKLTVPHSPNFTNRVRQPVAAKLTLKSSTKPTPATKLNQTSTRKVVPKQSETNKSNPTKTTEIDGTVISDHNKSKSTFMVPLTPEAKGLNPIGQSPISKRFGSPRTPTVKPFVRKSFSESKDKQKAPSQLGRSMSSVSLARSRSMLNARKSVAPSTFSRAPRSIWNIAKEPSEKEKIQQWLEKRGRSTTSCRHLGCLGHQLKEFELDAPKKLGNTRKSVFYPKKDVSASPHFSPTRNKRQSNVLNTTFEKEEEPNAVSTAKCESVQQSQVEESTVKLEQPSDADVQPTDPESNGEERFHTPTDTKGDSPLDLTDLQEGRVDKLLETIAKLFNEPVYPGTKIQSWLMQSEAAFPTVKAHALYWDIRARIEERRGNVMEALDIYNEAVEKQAEPVDAMKQMYDNFLLRISNDFPMGQRTPLLKSLGLETPMIRRRLTTPRRPLLDSTQVFQSTTVKYELKLKQIFEEHMKENNDVSAIKKPLKTPIKFKAHSNRLSVACEGSYKLVATPVRRSMRPKANPKCPEADEVVYVDDLEQLSPNTKAKAVVRQNIALAFD